MRLGLTLLVLIGLVYIVVNSAISALSPHLLTENCQTCHLAESISVDNAHMLLDSQELLCQRCHPNALIASHPSGIYPTRTLPDVFKLDWQKKLTCSSCHDIHGENHGLMVTSLRGKEYCHSCHPPEFFDTMSDLGTSLFISGHTVPDEVDYGDNMDSFSATCLACHSNEAGSLNVSLIGQNSISHSGGRVNHPIGINYQQAAEYGGYRPINQLDKRISLPEGKVSCISCHRAFDKKHGAGVFDQALQTDLCMGCHDI